MTEQSGCARARFSHRRSGYICAFFAALILAFAFGPGALAEPVRLRLIAFNDYHGHLEPDSNTMLTLPDPDDPSRTVRVRAGGAAWLAGLIGQLQSEAPNSMVFSSGDMISAAPLISTLFRQESTIEVMNAIGLDFGITGNHEFDAGAGELRRIMGGGCAANTESAPFVSCALGTYSGAKFPLLSANVVGEDGRPFFEPTLIRGFGGVKVGFIGVVTRTLPNMVSPSGIAGLKVLDEAETLNRYARELKSKGVNAIVAVVHEGGEVKADWNDEKCGGKSGEIFQIADKLSADIDLVFSAHTHKGYNCVIDTPQQRGLRVVQANSYGRGLSVVDVELDPATGRIDREHTHGRNIPVVNETQGKFLAVPSDPAVARIVSDYSARAADTANKPVGRLSANVELAPSTAVDKLDSPAGRLVADAALAAGKNASGGGAQIAFTNAGGVRAPLTCAATPPCQVTYGQAFTMQPFGNNLVVMTLTGKQLKTALEDQLQAEPSGGHFLQPSQGLTYTWKHSAPYGERVSGLTLNGAPVQSDGRYRVAVNSFLAEGGDGFKVFKEGAEVTGGPLDVDALVQFLTSHEPYAADREPRVKVVD